MVLSSVITTVSGAVKAAKEALAVADQLKNAELKRAMAELMLALADTQMQLAELKLEVGELVDENKRLKARNDGEKPKTVYGCYQFEGDSELYCPGCWASKGMKSPTTRLSTKFRKCSVCNNTLGA